MRTPAVDRTFVLLFTIMLAIAAGNTALQSVLPALGRSLGVADSAVAVAFSMSGLMWVIAAPLWARRSDRSGRRAMILLGIGGFIVSMGACGLFLVAGINGWVGGVAAFVGFLVCRMIYGAFGSAAPPSVQAMVAGQTGPAERTRALTLLGSAFGLGTILGPAVAPYMVLGHLGRIEIGLGGPALVAALLGIAILAAATRLLPRDATAGSHGATSAYPSIGGAPTGASATAAAADADERTEQVGWRDARVRTWLIAGLVAGHAQVLASQPIGFLVIDRLHLAPAAALEPTGLVLMMGAGAALLVQWGIIPLLDLTPRALVLLGLAVAAAGAVATGLATSLYSIATGYALASAGFGLVRPGFTAGASLAVGQGGQGSVAGKVTAANGAAFILGPSIGVGLYEGQHSLPYLASAAMMLVLLGYGWLALGRTNGEAAR